MDQTILKEIILEEIFDIVVCKLYGKAEDIDEDTRELIGHYCVETIQRVTNYCNISVLPEEMYEATSSIAVELMRSEGISLSERGVAMALEGIRLGDAQFDFSTASTVSGGICDSIIKDYFVDLHRYRQCAL